MKNRGLGFVFQPQWKDKKTGETRTAATWWVSFSVRGRRHRENAHSTKEADATRLLKKRIADVEQGKPVGPQLERTTINDLASMLVDDYKANGRRSLDRAQQACAHLRLIFGADSKARDISGDLLTKYQARRLEEGAKPSTVNYELAMLRRAFHLAHRARKVAMRPEFSMLHVSNARAGFFERDQYEAVLRHLPDYLRPVAIAAYETGWRTKSELLTRMWKHVDLATGWLRLEPGEGKTEQARTFPLTLELRAMLEARRERVRNIERATGSIVPWVFCHSDGSPIKDFRYAWAKACKAAGVPGRLVHDFRRSAVRNLERAGVPRSAAIKMTGHKTESVFLRYAITDSAMLQEAAAKLDTLHASANVRTLDSSKSPSRDQVSALSVKR
jgi:integrase